MPIDQERGDSTAEAVRTEMRRIRRAVYPASGFEDTEDLITYAKEIVSLRAALPQHGEPVAVKPLEWWTAAGTGDIIADSIAGRYRLGKVTANSRFRLETPSGLKEHSSSGYWPEDEAKAAAQADYEARIRSALVSPPSLAPGWPDPLESPQAEAIRNGKIDDMEIRNLFDCMEGAVEAALEWMYPGETRDESRDRARRALTAALPYLRGGAEHCMLTQQEAQAICDRLEFDASWDKCGSGYCSLKKQLTAAPNHGGDNG